MQAAREGACPARHRQRARVRPWKRLPRARFAAKNYRPAIACATTARPSAANTWPPPIDTPETQQDFDYLRWYLLHNEATVFVEEGSWYLLIYSQCRFLRADNRCGIYESCPQICRDYSTDNCEYEDDWVYEKYFETPEQVEEYVDAVLPREKGRSFRSRRPPLLPIIG